MYPSFAPEDFPAVYAASQKALKSATKAAHDSPDSQVTLHVKGWLLNQRYLCCNRHDFPQICKGVQTDAGGTCDHERSAFGDANGLINMHCAVILRSWRQVSCGRERQGECGDSSRGMQWPGTVKSQIEGAGGIKAVSLCSRPTQPQCWRWRGFSEREDLWR